MRLPPIAPSDLSPERKSLYDNMLAVIGSNLDDDRALIVQDDQGALLGPWNAWIHEPGVGSAIWTLSKAVMTKTTLPENLRQIAILTVGAHFKAMYEIYAHATLSVPLMGEDKVICIIRGSNLDVLTATERLVLDVSSSLVKGGPLSEALYAEAVQTLGSYGTWELIHLVAFYAFVSVSLNGFDVSAPSSSVVAAALK